MSNRKWTDKHIEFAKECLKASSFVKKAVDYMNRHFDFEVTTSSLRSAFDRYVEMWANPSKFCSHYDSDDYELPNKQMLVEDGSTNAPEEIAIDDDDEQQPDEPDEGVFAKAPIDDEEENSCCPEHTFWDFHGESYQVQKDGELKFFVDFDLAETLCLLYSNEYPGEGMSKSDVLDTLDKSDEYDVDYLTENRLEMFFDMIGMKKSTLPVPPHVDYEEDQDRQSAIQRMYRRADRLRKQIVDAQDHDVRDLKRRVRRAEEKLIDYRDVFTRAHTEGSTPPPQKEVEPLRIHNNEDMLSIFISDLHGGKQVLMRWCEQRNIDNAMTRKIFKTRVRVICDLLNQQLRNKDVQPYLYFPGDLFESLLFNLREGMAHDMYGTPEENWNDVMWALEQIITTVADHSYSLKCIFTAGNHDRMTKNYKSNDEEFALHVVCDRLKSFFRNQNDVNIVQAAPVTNIRYNDDVEIIVQHGHRSKIKLNNAADFKTIHGSGDVDRSILVQGHFHRYKAVELNTGDGQLVNLPCITEPSEFSTDHLFRNGLPSFLMMEHGQYEDQILGPYNLKARTDHVLNDE